MSITKSRPTNPILPGFNPDPSICRVGSDYYLVTSTFEYFPGVPIYHSRDLVNWKLIGHALNRPTQLNMRTVESGGGIWAPSIRYHKGRWYVAVCCVWKFGRRPHLRVKPRGFFVYSDDISDDSAWSDPIPIDMLGIDQDLFFDDDGKVYLSAVQWTTISPTKDRFSTFGVEIDITTGRSLTRPVLLRQSDLINDCAEGPHIYKKDGYYYLLTAEGGTEVHHRAMIFRSKSPLGPYEHPPEGVNPLINNPVDHPTVRQTGHADLFQDEKGEWWAVFLAVRQQRGGTAQLGRESFIVPVEWPAGGWPKLNGGKAVEIGVVNGLAEKRVETRWRDDFSTDMLQLGWYHLRTPVRSPYSLTDHPGFLTLYANPYVISMQESPAMLLRKQTAYTGVWETKLDFQPEYDTEEAGTVAWWSGYSYIALFLRRTSRLSSARSGVDKSDLAQGGGDESLGGLDVVVRRVDENTDETKEQIIGQVPASSPVYLRIRAQPESYTCEYQPAQPKSAAPNSTTSSTVMEQNSPSSLTLTSKILCRDRLFESPYTGAHFGLFAQDTALVQSFTPAKFAYAFFGEDCEGEGPFGDVEAA